MGSIFLNGERNGKIMLNGAVIMLLRMVLSTLYQMVVSDYI